MKSEGRNPKAERRPNPETRRAQPSRTLTAFNHLAQGCANALPWVSGGRTPYAESVASRASAKGQPLQHWDPSIRVNRHITSVQDRSGVLPAVVGRPGQQPGTSYDTPHVLAGKTSALLGQTIFGARSLDGPRRLAAEGTTRAVSQQQQQQKGINI